MKQMIIKNKEKPANFGVLFTGGIFPKNIDLSDIIENAGYIVAADSGLEMAAKMNVIPDKIIGDMDSLSDKSLLKKYDEKKIVFYEEEKDKTDTELGLDKLWEYGCSFIIILGGGGGRFDHLLGVYSLFQRDPSPSMWLADNFFVMEIRDSVEIEIGINKTVSFFQIGCVRAIMRSKGLKWPLNNVEWDYGDAGVSNVTISDKITLDVTSGRILMVKELEENKIGFWRSV